MDGFTPKNLVSGCTMAMNHRVKKLRTTGSRCLGPEAAAKNKEERQGSPTGEKPMPRSHASSRSGRGGPAGMVLHVLDVRQLFNSSVRSYLVIRIFVLVFYLYFWCRRC